ncbi:hypothetical protein QOZ80_8BG0665330 [Eleusine coracana subsp. coracana]|nr:hypothetical protein QOZ80_8BG0665330 [Eleusine coracana subsp. coracana]
MGRPRGKGKKMMESASNDDDGSGSEEAAAATPKRRGRPQQQKPPLPQADADEVNDDTAKSEENGDAMIEPAVRNSKDPMSSAEAGTSKKKKKRRRRRLKRGSDESAEDDELIGRAKSKTNGFRQIGSRRKSTPRRAAEAGVECK